MSMYTDDNTLLVKCECLFSTVQPSIAHFVNYQCVALPQHNICCSVRSWELHRGRRLLRQLDGDDRDCLVLRLPPVLHPRRLRPLHLRQQEREGRNLR